MSFGTSKLEGDWPDSLLEVYASALRKTDIPDADDNGEEDSLLPDAAKTMIINNYTPLITCWEKARWRNTESWRESWLPTSMHGARAGHEAQEVSMNHSVETE
eukprot:3152037-Pyramimonas_sp.AAC.1